MTEENVITAESADAKGINNDVLNMTPSEEETVDNTIDEDALGNWVLFNDLPKSIIVKNIGELEFYGSSSQIPEMFKDWVGFIGEIQNPANTADNPYITKNNLQNGGKAALYAPLDEVLNNGRPVLSKHGFGLTQFATTRTGMVSIKTVILHKSGGYINYPIFDMPVVKNDAQGYIAGITYARRAALNPILGTHGESDDDGNSQTQNKETPKKQNNSTPDKDELTLVKGNIAKIATELGGKNNENLMKILCAVVESGNTNKITDLNVAKKLYNDLCIFREKKETK